MKRSLQHTLLLSGMLAIIQLAACSPDHSISVSENLEIQPQVAGQTATISGTVIEAGWDEPAVGALVSIAGLPQKTATDMHGNFVLQDVPVGQQEVTASFTDQSLTLPLTVVEGEHTLVLKLQ